MGRREGMIDWGQRKGNRDRSRDRGPERRTDGGLKGLGESGREGERLGKRDDDGWMNNVPCLT